MLLKLRLMVDSIPSAPTISMTADSSLSNSKPRPPAENAIDINYNFVDPATSGDAGHVYSITNNLDSTRSQNLLTTP
jgi:hypothetical protein